MAKIVNQLKQHAIIKLPKQITRKVKTPTINPGYARVERVERFKNETYRIADFAKSKLEVEHQLEQWLMTLENKAREKPKKQSKKTPNLSGNNFL